MNSVVKNSRLDWLDFALEVLIDKGPDQLKITPLCERKGVTKGSFYHHFKNRAAFIDSLMEHWYETMTLAFIEQANSQAGALQRLLALDNVITSNNIEAENHIRAWALKEPSIAKHLEKIDSQRQLYLAQCYTDLGLEPQQAKDIALMAYSSFLGMQRIHPAPSKEEILRVSAMALKAFVPDLDLKLSSV